MLFILGRCMGKCREILVDWSGVGYGEGEGQDAPQDIGYTLHPTPVVGDSNAKLTEENSKRMKVEQEAKAKADVLAKTKRKLEGQVRDANRLLETQVQEMGQKDASIKRLEEDVKEMKIKVGQDGRRMGSNG